MATNEPRVEAPSKTTGNAPKAGSQAARLDALDEFRARADGWMKEVTAQVARLASGSEADEKRREAIEKRLSDLEERIRSLMTLTELLSLDKNPFAAAQEAAPAGAVSGPPHPATQGGPEAARPEAVDPPAPATAPEPTTREQSTVQGPTDAVGGTKPPEPVQTPAATEEPGTNDDKREAEGSQTPNSLQTAKTPKPTSPEDDAPWHVPAPEAVAPDGPQAAYHPNDAGAEQDVASPAQAGTTGPATHEDVTGGDATEESASTRRRLLVVALADLLAPYSQKVDVERFTAFYVDARWMDAETARLTRRLVTEIAAYAEHRECSDLRALHESAVRILGEHDPRLAAFTRVDTETIRPEPAAADKRVPGQVNAT